MMVNILIDGTDEELIKFINSLGLSEGTSVKELIGGENAKFNFKQEEVG